MFFFFFKQKTAYDMRISDWSSDVCSSDLFIAQNIANAPYDRTLASHCAYGASSSIAASPETTLRRGLPNKSDRKRTACRNGVSCQVSRSEERRVGKEGVSTCRSREAANTSNK